MANPNLSRPTNISAAIMTHPSRLTQAIALANNHAELHPTIVCDPYPNSPGGSLRTAALAWSAIAKNATHHLVLQDDVILHHDFLPGLYSAVEAMPHNALAFFTEWGSQSSYSVRLGALAGAGWVELVDCYVPSLALVLPARIARDFEKFARTPAARAKAEDDVALSSYLRARCILALVSVPSLVDHAEGPSVAGNGDHGLRKAVSYLQNHKVAANSKILQRPNHLPAFCWLSGRAYAILRPERRGQLWTEYPIDNLLDNLGFTSSTLMKFVQATKTCIFSEMPALQRKVGPWLGPLVKCAIVLGALAKDESVDIGTALQSPIASRSLATLVPGALRRFVGQDDIGHIAHASYPMIKASVLFGYAGAR